MATNGIYTRGMVSKSGYIYKVHVEIYNRKDSKITEEDVELKGSYTLEEIQDKIRRGLGPGRALVLCEIKESISVVFEMTKENFYQKATCRRI